MRVAITRAAPEGERTAERLRAMGAQPVLAPLLTIAPRAFDPNVEGAQALIFTSINGVRAFGAANRARSATVLAVGAATATAALELGFKDVRSANGNVADLAAAARTQLQPQSGMLIHIGGAHLAGDLGGELRNAGFTVDRRIAYEAVAATQLPPAFSQPLDAVIFHSARAAQVFVALGAPGSARLTAAFLSRAAAAAAGRTPWKRVIVAPKPREEDLLSALLRA